MISYEVSISLVIIPVIFMAGSLNFTEIVNTQLITTYYAYPLFFISIIFFISMIAETNRTPFDLPEAEAELVAGYNVDYSSIIFAMFFLAEYGNMIMMSLIKSELFFGG
jgi:NADH-quinone oxidoreductase subunit H